MHLTHQLDTRRLELTKLLQTVWASGTTRIIARFFATARHSAPWAIVLLVGACVRDGCRWIVHAVRHTMAGRRADLAVQAELAFLRGTFTGPWTVWRIGALATSWRCARRFTSQPREAIG
jgi:hypothetical protein